MVTALKMNVKKGKVVDEMKDGKRVAVRKHLQSVIDKKGSQESFDASSIFLRSAKWTAHVEKSGARHRSIGHLLTAVRALARLSYLSVSLSVFFG